MVTEMLEKSKNDPYVDSGFEVHRTSDGSQILYVRSKIFDSEKIAQKLSAELQSLSKNVYPNLLPVIDFEVKSERRICSTHYIARAYLPYLTVKLSDLIYTHVQSQEHFSKQELVYLLYQSISGLAFLHSFGIFHQNLSSACIRQSHTGFSLHYDPLNEKSVPSPNSLMSPERRFNPSNFDKNKDDVYALGIILLQAGTLQHSINGSPEEELPKLQRLMPDNQLFYSTVREMLVGDPEMRMDSLSLITGLPVFDSIKTFFASNGSDPRFINSTVPRFWMKSAESERSSYFAPMKQSDGPGKMYAQNSLQAIGRSNSRVPQSVAPQTQLNSTAQLEKIDSQEQGHHRNQLGAPIPPAHQTWSQEPNSNPTLHP